MSAYITLTFLFVLLFAVVCCGLLQAINGLTLGQLLAVQVRQDMRARFARQLLRDLL